MEIVTTNNETGVTRRIPLVAPEWSRRTALELAEQFNLADRLSDNPPPPDQATALLAFALGVREAVRWVLTWDDSPLLHLNIPPTAAQVRNEYRAALPSLRPDRHLADREAARGTVEAFEWMTGERETLEYPAANAA